MPDWDKVYTEKSISMATPADVLKNNLHLLSSTGAALDYASGLSANGVFLANWGYQVNAWDLSEVAVKKINQYSQKNNLKLSAEKHDLENMVPNIKNQFDVVVVSYFLHRETLRNLYDCLKKDGLLFYQTFSGQQCNGQGPSRAAYRLKKNELLNVFSDMQLLYYREDTMTSGGEKARSGETFFVAKK